MYSSLAHVSPTYLAEADLTNLSMKIISALSSRKRIVTENPDQCLTLYFRVGTVDGSSIFASKSRSKTPSRKSPRQLAVQRQDHPVRPPNGGKPEASSALSEHGKLVGQFVLLDLRWH